MTGIFSLSCGFSQSPMELQVLGARQPLQIAGAVVTPIAVLVVDIIAGPKPPMVCPFPDAAVLQHVAALIGIRVIRHVHAPVAVFVPMAVAGNTFAVLVVPMNEA